MSNQSSYARNGSHPRAFYPSHPPMSSTDPGHAYGPARDMGPPTLEYTQPQPVEIEVNSSRTLPSPAGPASAAWDSAIFPSHGFGELSPYGPLNIPRQLDNQIRGAPQDPLVQWYTGNDGPWIPKGSISEIVPDERHSRVRTGNRMHMPYGSQYRQANTSDAGSYQFGAPLSDSGYGSQGTRRSDGNASIYSENIDDRNQDSQSLAGHVADFQPFQGMNEVLQSRDTRANDLWVPPLPSTSVSESPAQLVCPTCHKGVKTRSELKKHDLRHTKPFLCEYPGCPRAEGFSTTNDLDRHTKSKHPSTVQGVESFKRYRCRVTGCKSKEKSWPRLDNFRSHLKRVHHLQAEEEFEDWIRRAEFWESGLNADQDTISSPPEKCILPDPSRGVDQSSQPNLPAIRMNEPGWKQFYPDRMEACQDSPAPKLSPKLAPLEDISKPATPEKDASSDAPIQETVEPTAVFPASSAILENRSALGNILAPVSRSEPVIKEIRASPQPTTHTPRTIPQGKATRHDVSASDAKLTEAIKSALVGTRIPLENDNSNLHKPLDKSGSLHAKTTSGHSWPDPPKASTISNGNINPAGSSLLQEDSKDLQAQKKAIEVLKTLHDLGYIIQRDTNHSPKPQNPGSAASCKSENVVTCQKCGKFKGRPCELKKHMKRHSRPYGCTFVTCSKTFGSKNDWKRHENSQHFHLETWRCDEEKPEGGTCAKVCYRRQTFQDHLKKDHSISDADAIKTKVEGRRIGRNCQSRFWCGFCTKLVDLTKKGIDAWTERFDHIDDHFMGRHGLPKQDIQNWVPVDSDKPRGDASGQHSLDPSHGNEDSSSDGSSSGSPHGISPDDPDAAGDSSAHASNLDNRAEAPKRKHSGNSDDGRRAKKAKVPYNGPTVIRCCQCNFEFNPKFNTSCANCEDSHRFCNNCAHEAVATEE